METLNDYMAMSYRMEIVEDKDEGGFVAVSYTHLDVYKRQVLNISYNKEHYMFDQQHQRNNTVLFCGLESENGCATAVSYTHLDVYKRQDFI